MQGENVRCGERLPWSPGKLARWRVASTVVPVWEKIRELHEPLSPALILWLSFSLPSDRREIYNGDGNDAGAARLRAPRGTDSGHRDTFPTSTP